MQLRSTFLSILLCLLACTAQAQHKDVFYNKYVPNSWVQIENEANSFPATPARRDYYSSYDGQAFGGYMSYDRTGNNGTITGGPIVQPAFEYIHGRNLWKKYRGKGIKIAVYDKGYSHQIPHKNLAVDSLLDDSWTDTNSPANSYGHTLNILSVIAGRNTDSSKVIGVAPESMVFTYGGVLKDCIRDAAAKGCRVFTVSSITDGSDTGLRKAIADFHYKNKGVVIMSGADTWTGIQSYQSGCDIPWVVCVGTTQGGGPFVFVDSFYTPHTQYTGRAVDFVVPNYFIAANYDSTFNDEYGIQFAVSVPGHDNSYKIVGGTSFGGPFVGGLFALMMQRNPKLTDRGIYALIKHYSRPVTWNGITRLMPDFTKIR